MLRTVGKQNRTVPGKRQRGTVQQDYRWTVTANLISTCRLTGNQRRCCKTRVMWSHFWVPVIKGWLG